MYALNGLMWKTSFMKIHQRFKITSACKAHGYVCCVTVFCVVFYGIRSNVTASGLQLTARNLWHHRHSVTDTIATLRADKLTSRGRARKREKQKKTIFFNTKVNDLGKGKSKTSIYVGGWANRGWGLVEQSQDVAPFYIYIYIYVYILFSTPALSVPFNTGREDFPFRMLRFTTLSIATPSTQWQQKKKVRATKHVACTSRDICVWRLVLLFAPMNNAAVQQHLYCRNPSWFHFYVYVWFI